MWGSTTVRLLLPKKWSATALVLVGRVGTLLALAVQGFKLVWQLLLQPAEDSKASETHQVPHS